MLERLRPDLVVLDVYLPDKSGLAVLQEIRQRRLPVDVIMVTAAKDVATLHEAMQGGVLHYVVKPFDFARFAQALRNYRRFRDERSSKEVLVQAQSAQQVAEGTGVSRGTARRYLEYLEQRAQASLELRYGSAGRPEHLYRAGADGTD